MKKWDQRGRDDQKQPEEHGPVPSWCNLTRRGWKGVEICCVWASPARHGGMAKQLFSHEMEAEAVFAQNLLLFCIPKFPRAIQGEENVACCETAPSELRLLCCKTLPGLPLCRKNEIKMGEK